MPIVRSARAAVLRALLGLAAAAVLAIVFVAYLQPAFIVDLANRFILCF